MDESLRTCDSILAWLKNQQENKRPISPHLWMEAAQALNVLISDENDKLIDLESKLAEAWVSERKSHGSAVDTKRDVEALPLYKESRRQRAKIEQIKEAIRLAKLSARIKSDELRSGL